MPERLPQLLDRIGKEALLELRRRGVQINPFLLGRHHHCLDAALRRVVAHQIPLASAEGALRVAYWDQMYEFLRRSPVPQVIPLEWSGPLKDVVNVLVVGIADGAPEGLLVRPDSVINDLRRILHWTMLHSRFDLICFPRVPLVDVPASTANLLRSLAKDYRSVIQIGWYDAAGNAGDHVVLYVPTLNDHDSVVQRKLFADPAFTENTSDLAIQQLVIAPTHAGNLCTLIGDDVEHESVRDLVCRQSREADGIDIILNIATGTERESPAALSRLCTDADAYGLWIQRGARSILCAPGAPDHLGSLIEAGADPPPGINLTSFAIHLAPLRRMRRRRAAQDASPGRTGARVPPPAWEVTPTLASSIEALRKDVEALGRSDKPSQSPPADRPGIPPELRASLDQISRVLATLGTSVMALADSSRASNVSAESTAAALKEVAAYLAQLQARTETADAATRAEIATLSDTIRTLQSKVEASRHQAARDASDQTRQGSDDSGPPSSDAVSAVVEKSLASSTRGDGSANATLIDPTQLIKQIDTIVSDRLGEVEGKLEAKLAELAGRMDAAESRGDEALDTLLNKYRSSGADS